MTTTYDLIKNILNIDEGILKTYKSISFREERLEEMYIKYDFLNIKNKILLDSIGILLIHLLNISFCYLVFEVGNYFFIVLSFSIIDIAFIIILLIFYFRKSTLIRKYYKTFTCIRLSLLITEYMISAFLCLSTDNLKVKLIFGKLILTLIHIKNMGYLAIFPDNFFLALMLDLLIIACLLIVKLYSHSYSNNGDTSKSSDQNYLNSSSNNYYIDNSSYKVGNELYYYIYESITVIEFMYEFFWFILTYFLKRYFSINSRKAFLEKYKFKKFYNYCDELICGLNGFHVSYIEDNVAFISTNFKGFLEKNFDYQYDVYDTKNTNKNNNQNENKEKLKSKFVKVNSNCELSQVQDFEIEKNLQNKNNLGTYNNLKTMKTDKDYDNTSENHINMLQNSQTQKNISHTNNKRAEIDNADFGDKIYSENLGQKMKNKIETLMSYGTDLLSKEKCLLDVFLRNLKYCEDENIDLMQIIEILAIQNINRKNTQKIISNNVKGNIKLENIDISKNLSDRNSNIPKTIGIRNKNNQELNETNELADSTAKQLIINNFKKNGLNLNYRNAKEANKKPKFEFENIIGLDNCSNNDEQSKKAKILNVLEKNNSEWESDNGNYIYNKVLNENAIISSIKKKISNDINNVVTLDLKNQKRFSDYDNDKKINNSNKEDGIIRQGNETYHKKENERNYLIYTNNNENDNHKKKLKKSILNMNKKRKSLIEYFKDDIYESYPGFRKSKDKTIEHFRIIGEFKIQFKNRKKFYSVYYRKINNVLDIFFNDCTNSKKAENIESENKLKQKILSKIAHEFKTPLNSILGLINNLKLSFKKCSAMRELDLIQSLSNYTIYLISDVIQYASNDSSNLSTDKNDLIENKKIEKSKSLLRKKLNITFRNVEIKKNLYFCFDILNALLSCHETKKELISTELFIENQYNNFKIINDEVRINQILLNLISNSVKFTKRGKIILIASFVQRKKDILPQENNLDHDNDNKGLKDNQISCNNNNTNSNILLTHNNLNLNYEARENLKHLNKKSISLNYLRDPKYLTGKLKNINNNIVSDQNFQVNNEYGKKLKKKKSKISKNNAINNTEYYLRISVLDTGIGILEEKQKQIFNEDMKMNTDHDFNHQGSGLGLSICINLIKLLNLRIIFSSKENCGSIFSLLIPAIKLSPKNVQKESIITSTKFKPTNFVQFSTQNSLEINNVHNNNVSQIPQQKAPIPTSEMNNNRSKRYKKFLSYQNNINNHTVNFCNISNNAGSNNINVSNPSNSNLFIDANKTSNAITENSTSQPLENIFRSINAGQRNDIEKMKMLKKYSMKFNINNNILSNDPPLDMKKQKSNFLYNRVFSISNNNNSNENNSNLFDLKNNNSSSDSNHLTTNPHGENPKKSNFFKSIRFKSSRIINMYNYDNIQVDEFSSEEKMIQPNKTNKIKEIEIASNIFSRSFNKQKTAGIDNNKRKSLMLTKNFEEQTKNIKTKTLVDRGRQTSSSLLKKRSRSEEHLHNSRIIINEISNTDPPIFEHFYMKCDDKNLNSTQNQNFEIQKNTSVENLTSDEISIQKISLRDISNNNHITNISNHNYNTDHKNLKNNIPLNPNPNPNPGPNINIIKFDNIDNFAGSGNKKAEYFTQSEENNSSNYKQMISSLNQNQNQINVNPSYINFSSNISYENMDNMKNRSNSNIFLSNYNINSYNVNNSNYNNLSNIINNIDNENSNANYEYIQVVFDDDKYITCNKDYELINLFVERLSHEKFEERKINNNNYNNEVLHMKTYVKESENDINSNTNININVNNLNGYDFNLNNPNNNIFTNNNNNNTSLNLVDKNPINRLNNSIINKYENVHTSNNFQNCNPNNTGHINFPVISKTLTEVNLKGINNSLLKNELDIDENNNSFNNNKKTLRNRKNNINNNNAVALNQINNLTVQNKYSNKNVSAEKKLFLREKTSSLNLPKKPKNSSSGKFYKLKLGNPNAVVSIGNIFVNSTKNNPNDHRSSYYKLFDSKYYLNYRYDDFYIYNKSSSFVNSNYYSHNGTNNLTNTLLYFNPNNQNLPSILMRKNTISNNPNNNSINNNILNSNNNNVNVKNINNITDNSLISSYNNMLFQKLNLNNVLTAKSLDSNSEYQTAQNLANSLVQDKHNYVNCDYKNSDFYLESDNHRNSNSNRNTILHVHSSNGIIINNPYYNPKNNNVHDKRSDYHYPSYKLSGNNCKYSEADSLRTRIIDEIKMDNSRINIHDELMRVSSPYSELEEKNANTTNNLILITNIDSIYKQESDRCSYCNVNNANKFNKLTQGPGNYCNNLKNSKIDFAKNNNGTIFSFNKNFAENTTTTNNVNTNISQNNTKNFSNNFNPIKNETSSISDENTNSNNLNNYKIGNSNIDYITGSMKIITESELNAFNASDLKNKHINKFREKEMIYKNFKRNNARRKKISQTVLQKRKKNYSLLYPEFVKSSEYANSNSNVCNNKQNEDNYSQNKRILNKLNSLNRNVVKNNISNHFKNHNYRMGNNKNSKSPYKLDDHKENKYKSLFILMPQNYKNLIKFSKDKILGDIDLQNLVTNSNPNKHMDCNESMFSNKFIFPKFYKESMDYKDPKHHNYPGDFHVNNYNQVNNINNYYSLNHKSSDTAEEKYEKDKSNINASNKETSNFGKNKFKTYSELMLSVKKDLFNEWKKNLKQENFESFSIISHQVIKINEENINHGESNETNIYASSQVPQNKSTTQTNLINIIKNNTKSSFSNYTNENNINSALSEVNKINILMNPKLTIKSRQDNITNTLTPRLEVKNKDLIFNMDYNNNKEFTNNNLNNPSSNKYSDSIVFLVIDDNLYIRNSVKNILKITLKNLKKKNLISKEAEIFEGGDGIEALKFIIDPNIGSRIKGIFIDENMEYLNGSETIKIIRRFQDLNKIHKFNIATVTAFEDVDTRATILEAGVDEIYPKPLSKSHLEEFFNKFPIKE